MEIFVRLNTGIRKFFAGRPLTGMVSVILVACLLGGAGFGLWQAYTAPTERNERVTTTVLTYTLYGHFGYDVQLTNNTLYGPVTINESDTMLLFLNIVESIEGSFSYRLISNPPAEQVSHQVEVMATLQNGELWSKPIELIPETVETGDFTLTFPIDTGQLLELANTINEELGLTGHSFGLTVTATIHTVAETDYGMINRISAQSIKGTLDSARLTWAGDLNASQSGSFRETHTITTPIDRTGVKAWSAIGLGFVVLIGAYVAWNYTKANSMPIPEVEKEARQAKRKYRDVIVDVTDLPAVTAEQLVIPVKSLKDLTQTADQLLRPVLHKAEADKHTYCVIDGMTRYEYVSGEPQPPGESNNEEDRA